MSSFTISTSDITAPENSSISINTGADNTTSTTVTLSLSATDNVGITGYYASENNSHYFGGEVEEKRSYEYIDSPLSEMKTTSADLENEIGVISTLTIILIVFCLVNQKERLQLNKYLNLNSYNAASLHKESNLFFDWYLPGVIGKKKSSKYKKIIKKELHKLYKKIFFKNQFIVHRDFHVSNIMPTNKKLGVIDTQDAILGNPMYDLASLIDDVRVKVPAQIKNKTFQYYLKKCSIKKKQISLLKNDFDILSIQRNLKILGIFYRLFKRDNKPQYLKYLPYTWSLIELRMKNKIFKNLEMILKKAVNKKIRKKRNFK